MTGFEEMTATVLTGLQKQIEQSVRSDDQVRTIAKDVLAEDQRWRRRVGAAFLGGFLLFTSIGLLKPEFVFQPVLDHLYPPEQRFSKFSPQIRKLDFETLPAVREGVSPEVWDTMQKGDSRQYTEVLTKSDFIDALRSQINAQMVQNFGTIDKRARIDAAVLAPYMNIRFAAPARIVAIEHDQQSTSCGRTFRHERAHAIVVIPKAAEWPKYAWFGCSNNYPEISLNVGYLGNSVSDVVLVGVERRPVDDLQIKLSRFLGQKLKLPGAADYTGKSPVAISISKARNRI